MGGTPKKEKKVVRLNLACGADYKTGWINIDNQQMYHGDFKVDMKEDVFKLTWKKNAVDAILVNHFIQYCQPPEMKRLLEDWYSWLKPGGQVIIEAGNILSVCKRILEAETVEELHDKNGIMQLYGIDDNIWNKWAWCPESISILMHNAGFKEMKVSPGYFHHNPKRDFVIVGTK